MADFIRDVMYLILSGVVASETFFRENEGKFNLGGGDGGNVKMCLNLAVSAAVLK
jgi:hypothetical protein